MAAAAPTPIPAPAPAAGSTAAAPTAAAGAPAPSSTGGKASSGQDGDSGRAPTPGQQNSTASGVVLNPPAPTPAAAAVAAAVPSRPAPPPLAPWQAQAARTALAVPLQQTTLALHSATLGSVQIHADLRDSLLGATITVDRPELHAALAGQLPVLERTLANRQLQVGSLQLQQQATGGQSGQQGGSAADRRPQSAVPVAPVPSAPPAAARPPLSDSAPHTGSGRLNLRA
ncbi:MAG TPA: flagellar hook-length control protein FliK [Terriglobales bacterium]|nr:flagellar hook-length control protein FliK [Terriglobales bacterium]